ncbi:MAG TPA: SagB/ThcOx family dehydrogenase [Terriglobia bacterium]|nr:SagB/ThcOx family dehydrogenase [Terriglobia bacterium]
MLKHLMRHFGFVTLMLIACATLAAAQDVNPVSLPPPQTSGGRPLMQVLKDRHSTREFSNQKLSPQVLSNLLWAAFGVNRPDGKRTAPSAINWQEIDIYVATQDGVHLYDAKANALNPVLTQDIRGATGQQAFVKEAAVNLVYVADLGKTGRAGGEDQTLYTAADTGFIAQNVYLFCASEGLAAVVRGSVDRAALAKLIKLRPNQKIILAQTVGYPK